MATPKTRYNALGIAGGKGRVNNNAVSDPFIQQIAIPVTLVASAAEQDTGFTLPDRASELHVAVNILTASTGGTTETIDVGVTGNPDALIDGAATTATGLLGRTGGAGEGTYPVQLSGTNITYALGSADITGLVAEIVVTYVGAEVE